MKEENEKLSGAENPPTFTGLKKESVSRSAAGIPALISAVKHIAAGPGIIRGMKALNRMNKTGGFDCPGCAWPDPDDERSGLGEYCENGAKALADEATAKKLTPDFFRENPVSSLAQLSDYEIGRKGRIAQPMYLPAGSDHYEPVSWDFAFGKIASALQRLSSPDEAVFYTSGRTSNEAAFLYQLFVREFGTNNLPDCSNMCHESSGVALGETLGIGKGSVTLEDFNQAEVIIIIGQNPGTNHPRMLTALQKAKKNGARIISINPLPEAGLLAFSNPQQLSGILGQATPLSDLHLPVKISGDQALLLAIEKLLLEEELTNPGTVFDHGFINQYTAGYHEWMLNAQQTDLQALINISGIAETEIRAAAQMLMHSRRIIICWAMGLTQHRKAVDTIKEIVNLLLLKGSIGIPGGGTCPVRGHSNVQGDRTMGIVEKPSPDLLQRISENFGFHPPVKHGFDVVESIRAMKDGRTSVFFAMGGNFLSATPDTLMTAEALRNCSLTVHVSTKLNRSHLVHGKEAIILPCLARSDRDFTGGREQFVSCENSMGVVQVSGGVLKPVSDDLLSEVAIVCRLAIATLGDRSRVNWLTYLSDYDEIRHAIEKTIPGFEKYNEKIRMNGGFYLPNGSRDRKFHTASGKALFTATSPQGIPLKENELLLMTIRSHDQFNTTIYGLDDRYRGIYQERRIVLLNQRDMHRQNLKEGDIIDLVSDYNGTERTAHRFKVVAYPIPEGNAATYFPEANVLVPLEHVAEKSNTPASKEVIIRIKLSTIR